MVVVQAEVARRRAAFGMWIRIEEEKVAGIEGNMQPEHSIREYLFADRRAMAQRQKTEIPRLGVGVCRTLVGEGRVLHCRQSEVVEKAVDNALRSVQVLSAPQIAKTRSTEIGSSRLPSRSREPEAKHGSERN